MLRFDLQHRCWSFEALIHCKRHRRGIFFQRVIHLSNRKLLNYFDSHRELHVPKCTVFITNDTLEHNFVEVRKTQNCDKSVKSSWFHHANISQSFLHASKHHTCPVWSTLPTVVHLDAPPIKRSRGFDYRGSEDNVFTYPTSTSWVTPSIIALSM